MPLALFEKRPAWRPTRRGWLVLVLGTALLGAVTLIGLHPFLSVNHPVEANILVVEGWLADDSLRLTIDEFHRGHYDRLVAAGGPLPKGSYITGFETWAAATGATLKKLGLPADRLVEAPGESTLRQRTFHSALAVRARLRALGLNVRGLNVVTEGPHARRTWAVFRRVFGPDVPVGVIALPPVEYVARDWWRSSEGVKSTLAEAAGWLSGCFSNPKP